MTILTCTILYSIINISSFDKPNNTRKLLREQELLKIKKTFIV